MITNEVKKYRLLKNVSQAQLSTIIGISERHMQDIEGGYKKPNVYTAQLLADALGTTVSYLFPIEALPGNDNETETA